MGTLRKLAIFALVAAVASAQDDTQNNTKPEDWKAEQCDCYLTDGIEPEYYTQHRFWDFRSLPDYAGTPEKIDDENATADADLTSKYFDKKEWKDFWSIQSWSNRRSHGLAYGSLFPMVNSPNNVYIRSNPDKNPATETYLTLRTNRQDEFQVASEFDSIDHFQYLSIRFMGRVRGSPGACMAMFTYVPAEEIKDVQEADVEILTREDVDRLHYTNHPGYSIEGEVFPRATRNVTLPDGIRWNEWVEHRLDWTPAQSTWYANGISVANISYQVPRDPSLLIFNSWGDGGVWTQNMTTNEEAYMEIQWIQMAFNVSETSDDKRRKRQLDQDESSIPSQDVGPRGRFVRHKRDDDETENVCRMVCSIDEGGGAGAVSWLWGNNTAPSTYAGHGFGDNIYTLMSWAIGLVLILGFI